MSLKALVKRGKSRGYTVVEVLSAMTLFAIGAAGVISMQRVTIQGGDDARRMDVAVGIANEWSGRFQRDAAFWQNETSRTNDTLFISSITAAGDPTAWIDPSQSGGYLGRSGAFDLYGRERPTGSGDHIFCAQYQLSWLQKPQAGRNGEMMLVGIRVFWARLDNAPILNCSARALSPDDSTAPNYYHFVYLTTAVRSNPPDQ